MRGKQGLEESLDFYVQGELMEGDNQYLCEELGKKVGQHFLGCRSADSLNDSGKEACPGSFKQTFHV